MSDRKKKPKKTIAIEKHKLIFINFGEKILQA